MESQTSQFLDLYRTGVRTASDVMKASLESAERMQNQQLQLIRSALEEAQKLMDIWRVAGDNQAAAARLAASQVQAVSGSLRDSMHGSTGQAANHEKRPEPQRKSA